MKDISSIELGEAVLKNVLKRVNLPAEKVEYVFYGTAMSAEIAPYTNIPARQAMLRAGYPPSTLSMTIDRACCSSMAAFILAYEAIRRGDVSVAVAAGSENLSNIPYIVSGVRWGKRMGDVKMQDIMADIGYAGWAPVSVDADKVAYDYGVSREEQDAWAYQSQQRYKKAFDEGKFRDEIIPYTVKDAKGKDLVTIEDDRAPRPETTMEKLASLQPIYGTRAVTAGNAPGLNAGAAAILLMSKTAAEANGLEILAYVRDTASVADEADQIATVPAGVIERLLRKNDISIDDVSLIEINEAFAAVPTVATKILANGDAAKLDRIRAITNVNGGAIAIGHPMGATGVRLVLTLLSELRRRNGKLGIATLCGGLAQGDGVLIEAVK
jgi:acetyl-CoA C-acetyltransferase